MATPSTSGASFAPELRRALARQARAELAKRSLAEFVRQAIENGVVHGIRTVEWGPHLDAICFSTQMQLEAWLVAYGHGTPEMIERQREAWERTKAEWEDKQPEPWLRYVLVQNEVDNLPPGTLKSTIVMVCANAWMWLWWAECSFGCASGIDANVTRDSNATRDLIKSRWYRESFSIAWTDFDVTDEVHDDEAGDPDIKIRSDNDSVSDWGTTAKGRRYSRTIQRGFTGLHVDITYIDDPDDADKVWNEAARLKPQNRFTRAIENRVNDEHRSIRKVMQQVVHAEGFTAYLLSIDRWSPETPKGWAQLCIPAEYGFGPEDAPKETPYGWRDWRTEPGELMHPRLSAGVLADKKRKMPGYEGQYNQNARKVTVGILDRRHARFFIFEGENAAVMRERPDGCPSRQVQPPVVIKLSDLDRITLSVDAANSLNPKPGAKVSAVGLVVGGCRGDERYVLDDKTRVLGVSGTYRAIYDIIRLWPIERVLVELKALGPSVIQQLEIAIKRGWYIDPDDTEGTKIELLGPDGQRARPKVEAFDPGKDSKPQRAHAMVPDWEQGLWFIRDGAGWLYPQVDLNRKTVDDGYIDGVCGFPGSRGTDRMDATSQFSAKYRNNAMSARDRMKALSRL